MMQIKVWEETKKKKIPGGERMGRTSMGGQDDEEEAPRLISAPVATACETWV